jgi:hypothetical protein
MCTFKVKYNKICLCKYKKLENVTKGITISHKRKKTDKMVAMIFS